MFQAIRQDDEKNLLEKGFTLVELLIVVVILGILAGIVVFAVGNLTDNAKNNACKADAASVETAAEAYKANSSTLAYPTQMSDLTGANGSLKSTPKAYDGAVVAGQTPAADKFRVTWGSGFALQRGSNCVA